MISNMTMSQSIRFALAALICGAAACVSSSLALAQSARKAAAAEPSSREDAGNDDSKAADGEKADEAEPARVYKTDAEWRKLLTYNQYLVTRMKATEPAFSGKYAHGHPRGIFLCVCCGAKLFDSKHKFESGTGWPSFWRPHTIQALTETLDRSEYEVRVEVTCTRCGAHIGHVFQDGPPPTGLRYCTNSLSLKLESEPTKLAPPAASKTSSQGADRKATTHGIHRRGGRYQGTSSKGAQSASKKSRSDVQNGSETTTDGSS